MNNILKILFASMLSVSANAAVTGEHTIRINCSKAGVFASMNVRQFISQDYYKQLRTTGDLVFGENGRVYIPENSSLSQDVEFTIESVDSENDFHIIAKYFVPSNGYSESGYNMGHIIRKNRGKIVFFSEDYDKEVRQRTDPSSVFSPEQCHISVVSK